MLFGLFSMFSNFYRLDLHNKIHVAFSKFMMELLQNQIENWTSLDLVMVIGSACLLVFVLGI